MKNTDSRNIIDKVLDEYVVYGGPIIQRREVLASMRRQGFDDKAIDFWVFGRQSVPTPEDADMHLAFHRQIEAKYA